jgi:NTP pyrophosphatase (non-canonical NTP hydrolase)
MTIMGMRHYQVCAAETAFPATKAVLDMTHDIRVALEAADGLGGDALQSVEDIEIILRLSYSMLGLSNEAGEVLGKMKKIIRDRGGIIDSEAKSDLRSELSDVLWYLADCCSILGLDLGDVAAFNLQKLKDRKERGVLHGDGDKR